MYVNWCLIVACLDVHYSALGGICMHHNDTFIYIIITLVWKAKFQPGANLHIFHLSIGSTFSSQSIAYNVYAMLI